VNLKIDGIATSEHIDSSGELLIVENHDISDLIDGKGVLNFEHSNKAEDIVGAVIYAKKIMEKKDCENDRQRAYWDFSKKPFVYIIGELFEDQEHPGAVAVAAMIRYYAAKDERLLVGFSIEGATLEREDYILKESVGRRVAITLRSCNKMAIAGLYDDPKTKSVAKSIRKISSDIADLMKFESPVLDESFMPHDPVLDLHKALEDLNKALTAGMGNVAPGQLTGGAALTKEHITGFQRNRVKAIVRDWDRKRPLKEVLKAALPEVSDDYIHHFTDLAEELALKKSKPSIKLIRVGASHSPNKNQSEAQKKLMEGLYFDPKRKHGGTDFTPGHENYANLITKHRNDAGQNVLVKHPDHSKAAENSTHYYELANDVFGMGKHVPVTNYFKHPVAGVKEIDGDKASQRHHQAMEIIDGAKTPYTMTDEKIASVLKNANKDGSVHKMAIMDSILGADTDRNSGNTLIHPKGHLVNIDNDASFDYDPAMKPWYLRDSQPVHPEAVKWIKGIDPKKLAGRMMDQGHHPITIKHAVGRLMMYQKVADRPDMPIDHMRSIVNNAVRPTFGAARDAEHAEQKKKAAV
jgi:hypothetical protein